MVWFERNKYMDLIKPKALKKGDTIGVFAPSSIADKESIDRAKKYLIAQGYKVKIHPQTFAQNGNHAGTDQQKIGAIHDLFQDREVDAIFCARGGNGLLQYIDQLNYELIRLHPKAVIGFSDVTVLHHALLNKAGLVSFHGPIFQYMREEICAESTENCLNLLNGVYQENLLALQNENQPLTIISKGVAEGQLVGGNLTLLSELTKTSDFKPQFSGNIVFFEDTEDYAYKHDRQLAGLFLNEAFRQMHGLIVGVTKIDPDDQDDCPKHPRHSWEEILNYYLSKYHLNIPVVVNAPITHGQPNQIIPQGIKSELIADGEPSLRLTESPFHL